MMCHTLWTYLMMFCMMDFTAAVSKSVGQSVTTTRSFVIKDAWPKITIITRRESNKVCPGATCAHRQWQDKWARGNRDIENEEIKGQVKSKGQRRKHVFVQQCVYLKDANIRLVIDWIDATLKQSLKNWAAISVLSVLLKAFLNQISRDTYFTVNPLDWPRHTSEPHSDRRYCCSLVERCLSCSASFDAASGTTHIHTWALEAASKNTIL